MVCFLTLVSALLYGLAFIHPIEIGFLVIPALVILLFVQYSLFSTFRTIWSHIGHAFLWGWAAAALSHYWVYEVILDHSPLSGLYPLLLLVVFSAIIALTVIFWWLLALFFFRIVSLVHSRFLYLFLRPLVLIVFIFFYFLAMEFFGGCIAGQVVGYPLFSPTIPLARYESFLSVIRFISSSFAPGHFSLRSGDTSDKNNKWAFKLIPPVINKKNEKKAKHLQSLQGCAQALYQKIICQHDQLSHHDRVLFVSPESTFPYCLNEHTEFCSLWSSALPPRSCWLLGSQYRNERAGRCQAVYFVCDGILREKYVKRHLMPFGETAPPAFITYLLHEKWFGQKEWMDTLCCDQQENFVIDDTVFIPQICSEFFACHGLSYFLPWRQLSMQQPVYILFFVNDSWFREGFKSIIYLYTVRRAAWLGIPIVLIGHDDCLVVHP